jgi:hypothetical protein
MPVCKKCDKVFVKTHRSRAKLCNDCWYTSGNKKKKSLVFSEEETKVRICSSCGRKDLIYAKSVCLRCYRVLRRMKQKIEVIGF